MGRRRFLRVENTKDYTGFDDVVEAEHDYGKQRRRLRRREHRWRSAPMMALLQKKARRRLAHRL